MKKLRDKLKRIVSILAAVCVMVLSVPLVSFAEESPYAYFYANDKSVYDNSSSGLLNCFGNYYGCDEIDKIISTLTLYEKFSNFYDETIKYDYYAFFPQSFNMMLSYASDIPFSTCMYISYVSSNNTVYRYMFIVFDEKPGVFYGFQGNGWNDVGISDYTDKLEAYTLKGTTYYCMSVSAGRSFLYSNCPVYFGNEYTDGSLSADTELTNRYDSNNAFDTFMPYWGKYTQISQSYNPYANSAYDSTLGFTNFKLMGVENGDYVSNYGLLLRYNFPSSTWSAISSGAKLNVDYTVKFRVKEENSNSISSLRSFTVTKQYDLTKQSDCFEVDLFKLLNGSSASLGDYAQMFAALSGASQAGWEVTSKATTKKNSTETGTYFNSGDLKITHTQTDETETSENVVQTYSFTTFTVSAVAYGLNTSYSSIRRNSTVDLIKGTNTSYAYSGSDSDNLVIDSGTVSSDYDYVSYDSSSKSYSYYNSDDDTTSYNLNLDDLNITLSSNDNVGSGSGGGSSGSVGSVVQNNNNNVTVPDNINVNLNISASDGTSDNVTIEDDDLTDSGLRDDLKDGFGLLDDTNTAEKNDGFIAMISDFYSGIDEKFKTIIMFGISTSVGIAVLRMIFKR
jgi:hypothetical protein